MNENKCHFSVGFDQKVWSLPFDKIWETEELSVYNGFNIGSKRSYIKEAHATIMIAYINEQLDFDVQGQLPLKYLDIKSKIDSEKYKMYDYTRHNETMYAYEDFLKDIFTKFFNEYVLKITAEFVDKKMREDSSFSYEKSLNRNNPKFKDTLAWDDNHVRAIFIYGAACRLILPLVTHYTYKYDIPFKQTNGFIYLVYRKVIAPVSYLFPHIKLDNKLHAYLESIVKHSGGPNKLHWKNARIRGEHMNVMINDMKPTIITDIIPRCLFDRNIMAFISNVANNFLDKNINKNHDVDYHGIKKDSGDSSDFSDVDRFEANSAKVNEFQSQMHTEYAENTIKVICKNHDIDYNEVCRICESHFDHGLTDNRHKLQENLIQNFFAKDVGSVEAIQFYGGDEYEKLLVILAIIMEREGFVELQYALTGKEVSKSTKRFLAKPIRTAVRESSRYKSIEEKYGPQMEFIIKEKRIETAIMRILNSQYIYNHFQGPMKDSTDIILFDRNVVCDEYLHFIQMI